MRCPLAGGPSSTLHLLSIQTLTIREGLGSPIYCSETEVCTLQKKTFECSMPIVMYLPNPTWSWPKAGIGGLKNYIWDLYKYLEFSGPRFHSVRVARHCVQAPNGRALKQYHLKSDLIAAKYAKTSEISPRLLILFFENTLASFKLWYVFGAESIAAKEIICSSSRPSRKVFVDIKRAAKKIKRYSVSRPKKSKRKPRRGFFREWLTRATATFRSYLKGQSFRNRMDFQCHCR